MLRNKTQLYLLPVFVLVGVTARILGDLFHVPGFYDSIGGILASIMFSPITGFTAGLLSGIMLVFYYNVYIIAFIIPGITAVITGVVWRKVHPVVAIGVAGLLQLIEWTMVYVAVGGVWGRIPWYWRQRGSLVLLLDGAISTIIAYILYRCIKYSTIRFSVKKTSIVSLTVLTIVLTLSYIVVIDNEWSIVKGFPENKDYVKEHVKMDLVWLWMGEKGINNYYYPKTRFDRSSPGYQVWVGLYWVQGYHDIKDVSLVSQFAIWDQDFWLRLHGCPEPYTYVVRVYNITEIEWKGYRAYLMYGAMITRSDVKPYEEVWLEGFFITFYDQAHDRTGIVYAATTKENIASMKDELWRIVNSWDIGD